MDTKKTEALMKRLNEEWKDDPNVQSIWFGWKISKGALGDGPAVCFGVRRKFTGKDEILAAGSKPIPPEIDGIPTDVYPTGGTSHYWSGIRGQIHCSPLKGGCTTTSLDYVFPYSPEGGTLGGVCYYQDGRLMALSNAHVWGNNLGCGIVQPHKSVSKIFSAFLELLACGTVPAYFLEDATPFVSVTTGVLAAAAGVVWILAGAADFKDPHRRGQEATKPKKSGELTKLETVKFKAEPQTLPLPGLPYLASVAWDYTRQTDKTSYQHAVRETRMSEHILVRQHVWTEEPVYSPNQTVKVKALLETRTKKQPNEYHVISYLNPKAHKDQQIICALHPVDIGECPFTGLSLALGKANMAAHFPIQQNGFTINANGTARYRDLWPKGVPDGLVALEFPDGGLIIDLPQPAENADLQVVSMYSTSITLEAYDNSGAKLDSISTPPIPWVQHLMKIGGTGIARLILKGGKGKGLLRWISVKMATMYNVVPLYANTHVLMYEGKFTLDSDATQYAWQALLSAQTVSTLPPTTPPLQAAKNIGGIESAVLTTVKEPCTICLAMDKVFDVQ